MPWTLYLPQKTWYPLYWRLGGLWGWSRQARKISPPLGFDPWTVQPVASHYFNFYILTTIPMNTDNYMKTTTTTKGVASVHVPCVWQRDVYLITFSWYSGESRSWGSSVTLVTNKDNGLNDWGFTVAEARGFYVLPRS
jgi:hypothetical protein